MKEFGLTETKLFHFHRILNTGVEMGFEQTPRTPSGSTTAYLEAFEIMTINKRVNLYRIYNLNQLYIWAYIIKSCVEVTDANPL